MTDEASTGAAERGSVIVLCADLFFVVGIRNTLRRLGFDPHVVKTTDDLEEAASSLTPVLVIVDMSAMSSDYAWDAVAPYIRHEVPVIAFGPHRDVDAFRAAKDAGVTRVFANSQFHREMAELIERYAASDLSSLEEPEPELDDAAASEPPGTRHDAETDSREEPT